MCICITELPCCAPKTFSQYASVKYIYILRKNKHTHKN